MRTGVHGLEWHDRVAAYALGVEPDIGRSAVEAHLAVCGDCRRHLEAYARVADRLEEGWLQPPRGALHRILAGLGRARLDGPLRQALDGVQAALEGEGLDAACALLNERAPHRFTGAFRLEPPYMSALGVFDRSDPGRTTIDPIRLASTYCSFIVASRAPFHTDDAAADDRLIGHPYRERVRSYCGVLLSDESGRPWGTLCHFDPEPRSAPLGEIPLLEATAPLIMRHLGA